MQADDGYLYMLDRAFFYVHKPPLLISFDEVDSVEFTRLGGSGVSSKTFDLVVRTRGDTEHQFRWGWLVGWLVGLMDV
jgi:structure-specific recognition protein 1